MSDRQRPWRRSERASRNQIIWEDVAHRLTEQGYTPVRIWRSRLKLILAYNILLNLMARACSRTVQQIEERSSISVRRFLLGMRHRRSGFQKVTVEALRLDDPALDVVCPHCGKVVPADALPDPDGVSQGSLAPIFTDTKTDKDKAQAAAMIEAGAE